jgi:PilZ domain-containing protein
MKGMKMPVKIKTTFLDENNRTVLICPKCRKTKSVDVSKYLQNKSQIKLNYTFKCDHCECGTSDCTGCETENCSHGYSNTVVLERRIYERKKVNFQGVVFIDAQQKEEVRISDLSRTGIQFRMKSKHSFKSGERAIIEFNLDDTKKTSIRKEISINKIGSPLYGASFCPVDPEDDNDQAIAYYLFAKAIPLWQG